MTSSDVGSHSARRFWRQVHVRKLIPYVIIGVLVVLAVAFLGREISDHIDAIEAWLAKIHPWGAVVYLGLFVVLTSLLVPSSAMAIIAGALFGLGWGTVAVVVGALVASPVQYALSRWLLRGLIERKLAARPEMQAIMQALKSKQLRLQVMLRLSPLSAAIGSYLLGAAGVRFGTFVLATFGLVPGLFLEIYFGHAGKHLAKLAGGEATGIQMHDVVVIAGLTLGLAAMVFVSIKARQAVQSAVKASAKSEVSSPPNPDS